MKFNFFWKTFIADKDNSILLKTDDRLSKEEIDGVQKLIKEMQAKGKPASVIIAHLQKYNDKLSEYYKAKRAFETENKDLQSKAVIHYADKLDINKFQVLIGPNACPICRKKTDNGQKIFSENEITKDGFGHRPPFHPHCYCVLIPH